MPSDLPRFEGNERVDLPDFEFTIDEGIQAQIRQPNEQFLTDPDGGTKSWILDGFGMADLGGGQLKVTKGRAFLAQREGSQIHYGALTTEGDATKTLDLSGYGNATYNIYIRFQFVDADTSSRMFWNPSGPTEFAQSIQTRRQANWSLRVELASPGDEWVQIGTVQIIGGAIAGAGIVDQRNLYFEGSVSGTYASGWSTDGGGGANDRNADRQQYGVKDLQTFVAATRQCLEDIKGRGLRRWWEQDIGGMNIGFTTDPIEKRLAIGDVNFYLDGSDPTQIVIQFEASAQLNYFRTLNEYHLDLPGGDPAVYLGPWGVSTGGGNTVTLGVGIATFVMTSNIMVITGDAGANVVTTITGLKAATAGLLTLIFVDGFVTIVNDDTHAGNTIDLVGGANFVGADDSVLQLVNHGGSWYEVSRAVN